MASATMTMAPAPVPEWNPTTEADKKLKESLQLLASSTDAVMLTPGPKTLMETKSQDEQQKKFLLQSKAYFGQYNPQVSSIKSTGLTLRATKTSKPMS